MTMITTSKPDTLPVDPRLRDFHSERTKLANGYDRKGLLTMSDAEFERHHGFKQWAFPTPEKSYHNFSAPLLDLGSALWLSQDLKTQEFLEQMSIRFLTFLKNTDAWKARYNHNHLRITRILHSLRILHSIELSNWVHDQVRDLAGQSYDLMEKARGYWDHQISSRNDKIAGTIVGLAIGDALGAPVEFSPRGSFPLVTRYREGGRFNLPAGAWTDDTAMALCLADSLIETEAFDAGDLLTKFCNWAEFGHNSSTGIAVGIGQNTLRTLGDYRRHGRLEAEPFGAKSDGNGSLMRLSPAVCFACYDEINSISLATQQSKTTHASPIAEECCKFTASLLCKILNGQTYHGAKSEVLQAEWSYDLREAVDVDMSKVDERLIRSGGFVLDTLRAALWSIENSRTFEEAVLRAVNLGDDADTTGAVTGQIAGALFGYSGVPELLKTGLVDERRLYVTSQLLSPSYAPRQNRALQ